ncbi:MAG TPA: hypothetical protein VFR70_01405 [Flavobacterium sp.]|nr:hypothetical protein [Flavobacterium sp.]
MKNIDKYIFFLLLIASLAMIFSCNGSSRHQEEAGAAKQEETYTSEGTISSGTRDTMHDHTNKTQADKIDAPDTQVPVKGETAPQGNQ